MARWSFRWDGEFSPQDRPVWLVVLRITAWIIGGLAVIVLGLWGVIPR